MAVNHMILGRMGYEFSTCSAGSEVLFRKVIQTYGENGYSGASRYGYEIFIDLKENAETNMFDIVEIYSRFLRHINNPILKQILELSKEDKNILISEFSEKLDWGEDSKMAVFSLADSFKYYLANPNSLYKSVILSAIVSYGRDSSMSHQCSIIALGAPHNVFLFYEPYGMYIKYGFSYAKCMGVFLTIFTKLKAFSNYTCHTYHEYFSIPKGIQNMMLDYGVKNEGEFLLEYNKIKKRVVDRGIALNEVWKYEGDPVDKTFALCTLMDIVAEYPEFVKESAELYFKYSAKTCVTIFLIETTKLLMLIGVGNTKQKITAGLGDWYRLFVMDTPSIIMGKLNDLMGLLYDSEQKKKIYGVFADVNNSPEKICEFLIRE